MTAALPAVHNLPEALRRAAQLAPQRGITIYDRRAQKSERRTFTQLVEAATHRAKQFSTAGVNAGDRLLLCMPTSWELLEAWFGAMLRGALPVLVAPPGLGGAHAHALKISQLAEHLGAKRIVCDEATRKELQEFDFPQAAALTQLHAELAALTPAAGNAENTPQPRDIAFMQLTSGSTGRQRAVTITHANVLHNTRAIADMQGAQTFDPSINVATWLPLNHDMGLVGCLLFAVVNGYEIALLRPDTFLARPRSWLQIISGKKSFTPAPNFAYQLCVDRIEPDELAGLDLSQWIGALTGAEMVRPETCTDFANKFKACGLDPRVIEPCYGMAEATLAVTADRKKQGVRTVPMPSGEGSGFNLQEVVCTGSPIIDTEVRICSPATPGQFLKDGTVGEVLVRGPSIFHGYHNDPQETAATLWEGWLRTGDLGFVRGGELYITGRTKEVLIINGANVMPHELEWIADQVSGGGGAERAGAFSIAKAGHGEFAVLVIEIPSMQPEKLQAMEHDIRTQIARGTGLPLADVMFIKRGQIPKTTSGKVQRVELRKRYLDGKLERLN